MGGNVVLNFLTQMAAFLAGPFGIILITCLVIGAFLASAAKAAPPSTGFVALFFGALALSGAYFVNTFLV